MHTVKALTICQLYVTCFRGSTELQQACQYLQGFLVLHSSTLDCFLRSGIAREAEVAVGAKELIAGTGDSWRKFSAYSFLDEREMLEVGML